MLARNEPISNEPLSGQSYARISEMIVDGTIAPSALIRETDLVRKLPMSRTPVREALHRLHAEGVITPDPRGGFRTVVPSASELVEVYTVNGALEGLAARLAAHNRNRSDLARLETILKEMDDAVGARDDDRLVAANEQFHHAIADAGRNAYLSTLLANIAGIFDRYREHAVKSTGRREPGHREHHAIVEAIAAEDADRAEALTREHMLRALDARLSHQHVRTGSTVRRAGGVR